MESPSPCNVPIFTPPNPAPETEREYNLSVRPIVR